MVGLWLGLLNIIDIPSSYLLIPGYLPLLSKDSCLHMNGQEVYVQEHLPMARRVSLDSQTILICVSVLLYEIPSAFSTILPLLVSCVLDSISDNIDTGISLYPLSRLVVANDNNLL